jgi:transcriptional regulator with XRE-family HTH domain
MQRRLTGNQLRRERLRIGWSRNQLAHEVGVSAEDVASWEEGSRTIDCPVVLDQVLRQHEDPECSVIPSRADGEESRGSNFGIPRALRRSE